MQRPSIRFQTDWMPEALRQLDAIERLPDGWDSRGGRRPEREILATARTFLAALVAADDELVKPHIHPTPSGGVQFHWESGSRYFEIELVDADTAQFYFLDRAALTEAHGDLRMDDPLDEIVEYARRVSKEA
jgi:hypothetical protein